MNNDLARALVRKRSSPQRTAALRSLMKKPRITEDDPRWDPDTMGNRRRGPVQPPRIEGRNTEGGPRTGAENARKGYWTRELPKPLPDDPRYFSPGRRKWNARYRQT